MAQKIMLVRHAEKPEGSVAGVDANGAQNAEELVVRGWQRSGGLVRYFAPLNGPPASTEIVTPQQIYAAAAPKETSSLRPQHTVLELAAVLGLTLNASFDKGDEAALGAALSVATVPTLVCWQHQNIPAIVNAVVGNDTLCPQKWDGSRFDLVWVLDRSSADAAWTFTQVPQMLLSGDRTNPIT